MSKEKYVFRLRKDMPPGFKKNDRIPELPAMTTYLKQYERKTFSKNEFENILDSFKDQLEKVPYGIDRVVREGLHMSEYKKDKYVIFCYNDGPSGECQFGTLEKIVK